MSLESKIEVSQCPVAVVDSSELSEARSNSSSSRQKNTLSSHHSRLRLDIQELNHLNPQALDDARLAPDSARTLADVPDDCLMSAKSSTDSMPQAGTQLTNETATSAADGKRKQVNKLIFSSYCFTV